MLMCWTNLDYQCGLNKFETLFPRIVDMLVMFCQLEPTINAIFMRSNISQAFLANSLS